MQELKSKYGLVTAISMVAGIVIGSGIFFKADDVLVLTNGSVPKALFAWFLGAIAMIFGTLVFGEYAQRISKSNGIVDYVEEAYGELAGYLVGWFKWLLYTSPLTAILGWVSANFTVSLYKEVFGKEINVWVIATIYVLLVYAMNYFAPILAGKFQVTTTFIKLIPIVAIAAIGVIFGVGSGTISGESVNVGADVASRGGFFGAVVATAFAYEGWVCAMTINKEIKDSKRNMPLALLYGSIIVFLAYVLYFMGLNFLLPASEIINSGNSAVYVAISNLFGNVGGTILTGFIVISCLGTFNGLALSNIREPHSLAIRGRGIAPKIMSKVNPKTNMPTSATIASLVATLIYLGLWYMSLNNVFGTFISIDEIPIVSIYIVHLSLYIWYIRKFSDLSFVKRYVVPGLAIIGAAVILYGGITNKSIGLYLLITLVLTVSGLLFYKKDADFGSES